MIGVVIERVMFNGAIILIITAIIFFVVHRAFKDRYAMRDKFLEDEQNANTARSRNVEPEFFYYPNTEGLPLRDNVTGDIEKKQNLVINCAKLTMVRFPKKMTNLELKSNYGVVNLEKITGYEENYNRYTSVLIAWAEALLEHGGETEISDAITILENTIELGSEYRKTYLRLADHYAGQSNADGLNHLLERVAFVFTDEGIKRQLTQYIMDKKESL